MFIPIFSQKYSRPRELHLCRLKAFKLTFPVTICNFDPSPEIAT